MKKKKTVLVAALLLGHLLATAQGLTVGDQLPDRKLARVLNYKKPSARLKDFRTKPLLLLFWNTECSTGIELLPKIDSVQIEQGATLQVLVVAYEGPQKVIEAFQNKDLIRNIRLPLVVSDSALWPLFPHRMEPHLVWISKEGRVEAITGDEALTAGNLQAFTGGRRLQLPVKQDVMDSNVFFSLTPLMVNDYEKNKPSLLYSSYLGGYRDGIMSGASAARYDEGERVVRIHAQNNSLLRLYRLAYQQMFNFHPGRIWLPQDSALVEQAGKYYCYDLLLRDTSKPKAYTLMRQDLDRFFGVTSRLEKRMIKVLVLKRTSAQDKIKAVPNPVRDMYKKEGRLVVRNVYLDVVVRNWNETSAFSLPLLDETGYEGAVDIELDANFKNLPAVRQSLRSFDLDLVEEEREMEVIMLQKEGNKK